MRENMSRYRDIAVKNTMSKNNKGITLIALVITIIVLLILAGVSISAITGNESAMEKAKEAKTKSEVADELDTIKLAIVEAVAAGYTGEIDGDVLAEKLEGIATVEPQTTNGKVTSYKITGLKSHTVYEVQPNGSIEAKSGISFEGDSTIIFTPNGETTATLTATLSEDLSGTINWSLSDGTVNENTGISSNSVVSITPLTGNTITVSKVGSSGSTTITASLPGTTYTATCTVKIVETVNSVSISPSALNLTVGSAETGTGTVTATAYGSSNNPTEATITYSSSDESVATVNSSGLVTAVGGGQATITAKAMQGTTEVSSTSVCAVTVTAPPQPISRNTTDDYVGCYVDFDGVDGIDGIIFADLLAQKPVSGTWGTNSDGGTYSWPIAGTNVTTENVKDYVITTTQETSSNFDSTPRYVIKPGSSVEGRTEKRFYVMALTNAASGKTWTEATSSTYGTPSSPRADGWYVPSKEQWAMFGNAFSIDTSNYNPTYKLSNYYWSSTARNSNGAWYARFDSGYIGSSYKTNTSIVRLCTTF